MGYFKSRNLKKKRKRKLFIIIMEIIILISIFKLIENKVNIKEKYLKILSYNYLQMDMIEKKEEKTEKEQIVFKEEKLPIVYIYNTHQTENYKYNKITSYNIDYSVMFASYILQSYLDNLGIASIVETKSISQILKNNNWVYGQSYKASRILLEQSILDNPNLKYFIDIHRDSSSYERTTCEIDGVKYAKVLFVIGLEHDNYLKNKEMATAINNRIVSINECLSRGILEKSGPGVNGIYNQDFNENTILIEVGGQYNEIGEVNNTLKVLASVLYEYIMEDA